VHREQWQHQRPGGTERFCKLARREAPCFKAQHNQRALQAAVPWFAFRTKQRSSVLKLPQSNRCTCYARRKRSHEQSKLRRARGEGMTAASSRTIAARQQQGTRLCTLVPQQGNRCTPRSFASADRGSHTPRHTVRSRAWERAAASSGAAAGRARSAIAQSKSPQCQSRTSPTARQSSRRSEDVVTGTGQAVHTSRVTLGKAERQ
jgi:hypothetical protein